jgi:hypothetical protein
MQENRFSGAIPGLFDEKQPFRLSEFSGSQLVEVDSTGYFACIPHNGIVARILLLMNKGCNLLTKDTENPQAHGPTHREGVLDCGGWIEGVWVVLS